jgi:diguanylate cyclase (GGDEF)-like protein
MLAEIRSLLRMRTLREAELRIQHERLTLAINSIPQGLCMFDADQKLIICNTRYGDIYELLPEHTIPGASLRAILDYRDANGSVSPNSRPEIGLSRPWHYVDELRNGRSIAISYLPLPNGGSISTHEDITERRKADAQIEHMAHYDALTDLPNRVLFRKNMERSLDNGRDSSVALFCLDLDQFKNVNDTLGHPIGDELLKSAAARLRACLRPSDHVARLGGDEFAIIQIGEEQPSAAVTLAERVIEELSRPFKLQGHQIVVGASVGIALASDDGWEADRLLKNADIALYWAKADGRGVYRFFEPEMDAKLQARRELELDLRNAISLGEFEVHYQPIIDVAGDRVSSCEALLRWRNPYRGFIPPADFIPLAEEIGLIGQIGAWVLKEACSEAMRWPSDVSVSVNLSPVQFKSKALILDVISALGSSGLPGHRLELEITEAVLLNETEATISILTKLRELGIRIAMDDFGTGYSSLGYLRKFPFDKIKIDRSFVQDLSNKPDAIAIIRAVASLGQALGIATTAEGVETEEQLRQLKMENCTELQGYLLGKPQPSHEIIRLFERDLSDRVSAA